MTRQAVLTVVAALLVGLLLGAVFAQYLRPGLAWELAAGILNCF